MSVIRTSITSSFNTVQYSFTQYDDSDIDVLLDKLTKEYLAKMKEALKPELQKVIDQINDFKASRGKRQNLHVTIATERVAYRPAVSVRAQTTERAAIISKNATIFVWHSRVPDTD